MHQIQFDIWQFVEKISLGALPFLRNVCAVGWAVAFVVLSTQNTRDCSTCVTSTLSQRRGLVPQPSITWGGVSQPGGSASQGGVSQPGGGSSTTMTMTRAWLHWADSTYSRARPKNSGPRWIQIKFFRFLRIMWFIEWCRPFNFVRSLEKVFFSE